MNISEVAAERAQDISDPAAGNRQVVAATPVAVLEHVRRVAARPILTTNFRPLSIALVHLATRVVPDLPVIWIDHGYNTDETRRFVREITRRFQLNLQVYTPRPAVNAADLDGIPPFDTPQHARFTERVKIEPFSRALDEWRPDFWITGIRAEQTDFRRSLGEFSEGPRGIVRVAPFFNWTEIDVEGYIYEHELPDYSHYVDPTKPAADRECGLQTLV